MEHSMLESVSSFIQYYESIRRRTLNFIQAIPADKIEWSPAPGEFTFGDLIRHLAAAEMMFVGAAVHGRWKYAGHVAQDRQGLDDLISVLTSGHRDAMTELGNLGDAELPQYRPSLDGPPVRVWRLLMAMVEHEVHHRSQLAMYLTLNHIKPPHIYGVGVEEVITRATG
jgi:uncharacterized damage-inducible protein DinB